MMPSIAPVLAATICGAASDADGGQDRVSGVMSSRDARSPFFDRRGHVEIHDRNLPHWQQREVWVFVTWRLADSLPAEKLAAWNEEKARWLTAHPRPWNSAVAAEYREQFTARMEAWLDAGEGSCLLRDAAARKIVGGALAHFDHSRYELGDYVVMPNHVHVLVRIGAGQTLPGILHTWKSYTASCINHHCGRRAAVWQQEYWDRLVRDECHLAACRRYIACNPERAALGPTEFTLRVAR